MRYVLQLFVYLDTDRNESTQLGDNIYPAELPQMGYGSQHTIEGISYRVVDLPYLKPVSNTEDTGSFIFYYKVYLAKAEDWEMFSQPDHVRTIMENNLRNRQN